MWYYTGVGSHQVDATGKLVHSSPRPTLALACATPASVAAGLWGLDPEPTTSLPLCWYCACLPCPAYLLAAPPGLHHLSQVTSTVPEIAFPVCPTPPTIHQALKRCG